MRQIGASNHWRLLPSYYCQFAERQTLSHAQSETSSVQLMYGACKEEIADAHGAPFCVGYIEGVAQVMILNGIQGRGGLAMCTIPPASIPSGRALVQSFMNWAEKHPEHWSVFVLVGVSAGVSFTRPCRN
jgi:Rap1a immunity proteins